MKRTIVLTILAFNLIVCNTADESLEETPESDDASYRLTNDTNEKKRNEDWKKQKNPYEAREAKPETLQSINNLDKYEEYRRLAKQYQEWKTNQSNRKVQNIKTSGSFNLPPNYVRGQSPMYTTGLGQYNQQESQYNLQSSSNPQSNYNPWGFSGREQEGIAGNPAEQDWMESRQLPMSAPGQYYGAKDQQSAIDPQNLYSRGSSLQDSQMYYPQNPSSDMLSQNPSTNLQSRLVHYPQHVLNQYPSRYPTMQSPYLSSPYASQNPMSHYHHNQYIPSRYHSVVHSKTASLDNAVSKYAPYSNDQRTKTVQSPQNTPQAGGLNQFQENQQVNKVPY